MNVSTIGTVASKLGKAARAVDLDQVTRGLERAAVLLVALGGVVTAAEMLEEKWVHWRQSRRARRDGLRKESASATT